MRITYPLAMHTLAAVEPARVREKLGQLERVPDERPIRWCRGRA